MSEIKVGEYFRTDTGFIDKLNQYWLFNEKYKKLNIVKHSPNIIDLIEEGDYVNGYKVFKAHLESETYGKYVDIYCPSMNLKLEFLEHTFPEQIKSIVTKEMMESVEYRID